MQKAHGLDLADARPVLAALCKQSEISAMQLGNILSFILGGAIVGVVWFVSSFIGAAGSDAWSWTRKRFNPVAPEPIKIDSEFSADLYVAGSCAWVSETKSAEKEEAGYTYYPHPKNGAKCYRATSRSSSSSIEWLMVKPNAEKASA